MICRHCGKAIHHIDGMPGYYGDGLWVVCVPKNSSTKNHEPLLIPLEEIIANLQMIESDLR